MNILNLDTNEQYDLSTMGEFIGDIRYAVLDNSDPSITDYYFLPLMFMETFTSPGIILNVGMYQICVPSHWYILIGEPDVGDLEAVPLSSINNRGFRAFEYNPITGFSPSFPRISTEAVCDTMVWNVPRLRHGQYLCVPIEDGVKPKCLYFISSVNKTTEIVDYSNAF